MVGRRDIGKNDDRPKVWRLQCSQGFDHSGHKLRGSSTDIKRLAIAVFTTNGQHHHSGRDLRGSTDIKQGQERRRSKHNKKQEKN